MARITAVTAMACLTVFVKMCIAEGRISAKDAMVEPGGKAKLIFVASIGDPTWEGVGDVGWVMVSIACTLFHVELDQHVEIAGEVALDSVGP